MYPIVLGAAALALALVEGAALAATGAVTDGAGGAALVARVPPLHPVAATRPVASARNARRMKDRCSPILQREPRQLAVSPDDRRRAAQDRALVHEAEEASVLAVAAVVAEHQELLRRHGDRAEVRAAAGVEPELVLAA